MSRQNLFTILFTLCVLLSFLQTHPQARTSGYAPARNAGTVRPDDYAAIDKLALQMPDSLTRTTEGIASYINGHFHEGRAKTRAAFIWIASNIQYDLANMFALNFYEKNEDKIAKPLSTRKGICENFAALFTDVCSKTGVKSYVVEGYTRQNGFTDYIPHAWCAAFMDSAWYLFDPTWGSGYVNNGRFYKRINNEYFMARPSTLIRSHMPFDYLWQFLYYPVTNEQFYTGKTQERSGMPYFNYIDSLAAYEKQSNLEYDMAASSRIIQNGVKNSMIFDRLEHLRRDAEYEKARIEHDKAQADIDRKNQIVNLYNSALGDYNEAVHDLNDYVAYYNKQFQPAKPDADIQGMIDSAASNLKAATSKLDRIHNPDQSTGVLINQFRRQISDLSARVDEQEEWLKKYFAKGKMGRKNMFVKITWFGARVN
jgi:transglutaminase/protease-like cytokinesis protein 3